MAVITRYIVVRNGVELDQVFTDKKEAEAYDKMLEAAEKLGEFIKTAGLEIDVDARTIDALAIYLAQNAARVTAILKGIKPFGRTTAPPDKAKTNQAAPSEEKKKPQESKSRSARKGTER